MKKILEDPSIDLGASHMLSERSTIWARPPELLLNPCNSNIYHTTYAQITKISKDKNKNEKCLDQY